MQFEQVIPPCDNSPEMCQICWVCVLRSFYLKNGINLSNKSNPSDIWIYYLLGPKANWTPLTIWSGKVTKQQIDGANKDELRKYIQHKKERHMPNAIHFSKVFIRFYSKKI